MISIVLVAVFIQPVSLFIANKTSSFLPIISDKLFEYFTEGSAHNDEGTAVAFIKGTPYYIATLIGLKNRNKSHNTDKTYDKYLLVLCIGAVSFSCSIISYWLMRLISVLFFPMSISIFKILEKGRDAKGRLLAYIIVVGGIAFFTMRSIALNIMNYGGY